jgi:hypothetical protein
MSLENPIMQKLDKVRIAKAAFRLSPQNYFFFEGSDYSEEKNLDEVRQ